MRGIKNKKAALSSGLEEPNESVYLMFASVWVETVVRQNLAFQFFTGKENTTFHRTQR